MKNLIRSIERVIPMAREYRSYSKAHYYEMLSAKYKKLESYLNLLMESRKLIPLESDVTIKPELGLSVERMVKEYGDSYHKLEDITALKIDVLFYKFLMGGHKTKAEMHFHQNRMFLFIYTFSYLTPEVRTKIKELLSTKYLGQSVDLRNHRIIDSQGHESFVNDSSDFVIYYIDTKSSFFEEAEHSRKADKEMSKIKSELINQELFNRL